MNKKSRWIFSLLLSLAVVLGLLSWSTTALAQAESQLSLHLNRIMGYSSGFGSNALRVQGAFNLSVSGVSNLTKVTYYIDGQVMKEVDTAPFSLRFDTGSYSLGEHKIWAVGVTSDGSQLRTAEVTTTFVTAETGMQEGLKIAGPLLGLVLVIVILSYVFTFFSSRKMASLPPGTPRNYGAAGGTICPRCGRPYPIHFFAVNLPTGKLDRCPFCGKWSVARRKSMDELRTAEAAEIKDSQAQVPTESEEERLRRELDESRYKEV